VASAALRQNGSSRGAFVFIFGRRQEALAAALAEFGPNARAVKDSVSDEADLDGLYAAVKAEQGSANTKDSAAFHTRTGASRFISLPFQEDHLPATSPNLSANSDAGMAPARGLPNLYSKRNKETR